MILSKDASKLLERFRNFPLEQQSELLGVLRGTHDEAIRMETNSIDASFGLLGTGEQSSVLKAVEKDYLLTSV